MKRAYTVVIFLALLSALTLPALAAGNKLRCARCNMPVDETSRFSARISTEGKTLWFCDIGDMVLYIREKKIDPARAEVKDYPSGAWIAASQAFYVSDPKKFRTPMGWGLAAFQNRADASAYGATDALATLLKRIE